MSINYTSSVQEHARWSKLISLRNRRTFHVGCGNGGAMARPHDPSSFSPIPGYLAAHWLGGLWRGFHQLPLVLDIAGGMHKSDTRLVFGPSDQIPTAGCHLFDSDTPMPTISFPSSFHWLYYGPTLTPSLHRGAKVAGGIRGVPDNT
jgi:hypothetical protein